MGLVTGGQRKGRAEVALEERDLGNGSEQLSVNLFLGLEKGWVGRFLGTLFGGKELFFVGLFAGRLFGGRLFEEAFIDIDVDGADIDRGRGGNDIGSVDATERNTVDGIGARNEQETARVHLEQHNPLGLILAGQQNEHGTGNKRLAD
jgi:hypothetical protein